MKLDVLVFAAHPDDAELGCGGTILKQVADGKKVGITDLTRGERGTRGTAEIRAMEAAKAAEILEIPVRDNLGFNDCTFENDEKHRLDVIRNIRRYQPDVVLINAPYDRHPDHARSEKLLREACFLSGLPKIETLNYNGETQTAWRPKQVFSYIQDHFIMPTFIVDITPFFDKKMEAILAYESQFYNPKLLSEPETYISNERFLKVIEARSRTFGHMIGVEFGEGFLHDKPIRIETPLCLI